MRARFMHAVDGIEASMAMANEPVDILTAGEGRLVRNPFLGISRINKS